METIRTLTCLIILKNNKTKIIIDYYFLYNKHLASVYKKYLNLNL